jgi:hypothetical protein
MKLVKYIKQITFILILFVIMLDFAEGQIITIQGERFEYAVELEQQVYAETKIEFDLSIDNSTLIFIDSIKVDGTKLKIEQNNYYIGSYYLLHCSGYVIQPGNITLILFGTTLFSNDTLTYIRFNNAKVEGNEIDVSPIKVIVSQQYGHFYSRFGKITRVCSIPASRWDGFEIEYVIDVECDVNIFIVNEVGNNLFDFTYSSHPKGIYKLSIDTRNYPIGVYYIYFTTKTGANMYPVTIRN